MGDGGDSLDGRVSPLIRAYARLRAAHPSWYVEYGPQVSDGWIAGIDLARANDGPLSAVLAQIGARMGTTNRKIVAASFALRFGWSSAAAIGPFLSSRCIPDLALPNVVLKFTEGALFERVSLLSTRATMLLADADELDDDVTLVHDTAALRNRLRGTLLASATPVVNALYRWSRFPRDALWGQVLSSWAAQFTLIPARLPSPDAHAVLAMARAFFDDPCAPFRMAPTFLPVKSDDPAEARHERASCCLYYKAPGGRYCASCPIIPRARPAAPHRTDGE